MKEDRQFLNLRHFPTRVCAAEACVLLNCTEAEIAVLVKRGILKPLGNPARNGVRWFLTAELIELGNSREFWDRACRVIQQHWKAHNATQTGNAAPAPSER